jgi:glycosyltransferase involved in cell wall biosynthesis
MRIAYIAPYQGPLLVRSRPSERNLSLGGRVKIGLIAEFLQRNAHSVDILSQGEVIERKFKFYPALSEPEASSPDIRVYYGSAFPVKFVNALWSSLSIVRLFRARHRHCPFNLVMIYNLKPPQVACANYAIRRLGLPVVLEYEDDAFSDVWGQGGNRITSGRYISEAKRLMGYLSGCAAISPYLLSQAPALAPKLLLRGIVSEAIVRLGQDRNGTRNNRVVFCGTFERTQGLEQMITAWRKTRPPGWELHLAGHGPLAGALEGLAENDPTIVFHGWLSRDENAGLLCAAKIGMNPQDLTKTPGNVFALKIVEYLAAGLHVITTPRGGLEPELETGITYIADNSPATIAASLKQVVAERFYERTAQQAAVKTYGAAAISQALNRLLNQAVAFNSEKRSRAGSGTGKAAFFGQAA